MKAPLTPRAASEDAQPQRQWQQRGKAGRRREPEPGPPSSPPPPPSAPPAGSGLPTRHPASRSSLPPEGSRRHRLRPGSAAPPLPSPGARPAAATAATPQPQPQPQQRRGRQPQPLRTGPPTSPSSSARPGVAPAAPAAPPPTLPHAVAVADPASELGCARFGSCSGCSLQDGLAVPPLYGEAAEFFRGLGLAELPAVMRAPHGWRCRAKLAVRGPVGRPLIGLFREGSHQVVDIVGAATAPPPPPPPGPLPDGGILEQPASSARKATGPESIAQWPQSDTQSPTPAPRAALGSSPFASASSSSSSSSAAAAAATSAAASAAGCGRRGEEGGGGGGSCGGGGWSEDDVALGCRAHHPRINAAAALIKELVTQLRIPPYNEPVTAATSAPSSGGASTASAAASTAFSGARAHPGSSHSLRSRRRLGLLPQQQRSGGGSAAVAARDNDNATDPRVDDADSAAGYATAGSGGLLRYLQLTAVPSRPGGRAEDDPAAAVQVVLVLNASPECCEATDPRVGPVLRLCAELWRAAGPPGAPMAPAADTPSSPPHDEPTPSHGAAGPAAAAPPPPPLVHSIWLNFQPDARRNAILGEGWRHVAGPAAAWQEFGGVAACVGPGSFVQANYGAMQLVLEEIGGMVPYGSRVTEMHAGIGVIGLSLAAARRLTALRCVEVNPAAAAPFRASLERLRRTPAAVAAAALPPPAAVEYLTAEAGSDPGRFLSGCDVLVVDPPRKGLGQSLLSALTRPTRGSAGPPDVGAGGTVADSGASAVAAVAAGTGPAAGAAGVAGATNADAAAATLPSRLVYLSCGFRALQGDLAVLLAGGWRLRSATAYMFFPGTDSLETLVLLTRGE
ncbi:hypothetical protein PLESTM_000328900 [Pleodorina starrii]|nr:hypothetical protein PLESTM_000328900 [Pleodorina starrii]